MQKYFLAQQIDGDINATQGIDGEMGELPQVGGDIGPSGSGGDGSVSGSNNSPNVFNLNQLAPNNGNTSRILDNVLNYSAGIALIMAVFFIIYGGYQIMMAGDDPGKFESGVKTIKYTIIGILVIFLSGAIVNFIAERILNISIN